VCGVRIQQQVQFVMEEVHIGGHSETSSFALGIAVVMGDVVGGDIV
jgi:hypothetical protein